VGNARETLYECDGHRTEDNWRPRAYWADSRSVRSELASPRYTCWGAWPSGA
jgi:hypothetical protein